MVRSFMALWVGLTWFGSSSVLPSPAMAQDDSATPELAEELSPETAVGEVQAESGEDAESWRPPDIEGDTDDWLRLGTGEWLRGEIERMRDDQMEFDSRRLKFLSIKWKHIDGIFATTPHRWVLEGGTVLVGPGVMMNGMLTVQTVHGVVMAAKDDVLAILPGEQRERNRWRFDASLGITAMFGNSPQTSTSTLTNIYRESATTRLHLNYQGSYGRSRGNLTVNNHWAAGRFDWYATRYFFLNLIQLSVGHDDFRNLGLQATAGLGLGYTIIDTSAVDWSIDITGAYVYTAYMSVEAGADKTDRGGAVIPSTKLDIEITDDIDWGATHRSTLVVSNFDLTTYRTTSYLTVEITDIFDLNINFSWDRDRKPVAVQDGSVPDQDTFQLVIGVGVSI